MASKISNLASQISYATWYGLFKQEFLRPTFAIGAFNELDIPAEVKLVILDKDNCFAKPHTTTVWPAFEKKWTELLSRNNKQYELCVLSNTAGDANADPTDELAQSLEKQIGIKVLRHKDKKPMCYEELRNSIPCKPNEVLVVGDRLVTDVLMANLIGAQSAWIRPGVHPSIFNRIEISLANRFNIK